MENFPVKMEEITTKCILLESSQDTKVKINQFTSGKSDKKKTSNFRPQNNNNKNKNHNSNNNFSYKNNFNNKFKNNGNDNRVTDVQKISTKTE